MTTADSCGLVYSGASAKSLDLYEQAQRQMLCYIGDPLATINQAIAESPAFVMAHYLQAYANLVSTEASGLVVATKALASSARIDCNERESMHRLAIKALVEGRYEGAQSHLQRLLIEFPRDILALQVSHLFDFYRGDVRNLRNRPARVMYSWSENDPHYHAVLGMYAFGLEECNLYAMAEEVGQKAIELNPQDGWAHHAVAHVYEMQGQQQKGIDWMASREPLWAPDSFLAIHNWWHRALFHLDLDQIDVVLDIYDQHVRGTNSNIILDLVDASSLLWRLLLRNVDVGNRWQSLAEAWAPFILDDNYAFNSFHAIMAFIGTERWHGADEIIYTLTKRVAHDGANRAMTRDVGLPASMAFYAFGRGDYGKTVGLLMSVREIAHRFGGSHAQRDIIELTLLEAARRDHQVSLVRALASERISNKPTSPLARRYMQLL